MVTRLSLLIPPDMIGVSLMVRAPQRQGVVLTPVVTLTSVWRFLHISVTLEIYILRLYTSPQVTTPPMLHASLKAWIQAMLQPKKTDQGRLLDQANKKTEGPEGLKTSSFNKRLSEET